MSVSPSAQDGSHSGIALVTGASGFIGRSLVNVLAAEGYQLRALSRSSIDLEQAEHFQADIADTGALSRAMTGVDVVFHLAGVGSPSSPLSMVEEMYRVNVVGTHNVLEAAKLSGVRRVIVASSAAVYGAIDSDSIPEDSPLQPTSAYGLSKLAQEQVCEMYTRVYGLDVIALRLFNVYGAGEDLTECNLKLIPSVYRRLISQEPVRIFGQGGQARDFVHVNDVASAFLKSAIASFDGQHIVNIGTGVATTIREVVDHLAKALGVIPILDFQPSRENDVAYSVADTELAELNGIEPLIPFEHGILEFKAKLQTAIRGRIQNGR